MMRSRARPNFPVELHCAILQEISDFKTLAQLSLTCKVLHLEAAKVLYESTQRLTPTQHLRFLRSIAQNAQLASFVRSYALPPMTGSHKTSCWQLLRIALPTMTNLKKLSILAFTNDLNILPFHTFTFQLESLDWVHVDISKNPRFEKWLATQKAIKHLRLIYRIPLKVPTDAFPDLVSLEANLHVVEAILPGRKVEHLHLIADGTYQGRDSLTLSNMLSAELQHLQWLSFEDMYNIIPYNSFADYLHSLTFLEVIGPIDVEGIHIPPRLRQLVFSCYWIPYNNEISADRRPDAVKILLAKAPSLRRIDFAEERKAGVLYYECWEDGIRRHGLVHSYEVRESIMNVSERKN